MIKELRKEQHALVFDSEVVVLGMKTNKDCCQTTDDNYLVHIRYDSGKENFINWNYVIPIK